MCWWSLIVCLLIRSATECKKHQEQKQAKARNLREKLLSEKADRLHMLTKKVCSSRRLFPFGFFIELLCQVRRNRFGRPGGCRTNNLAKKNFYVQMISTFVNVKWTLIVLSLWPLSFSVIYRLFYSWPTGLNRSYNRGWQVYTCQPRLWLWHLALLGQCSLLCEWSIESNNSSNSWWLAVRWRRFSSGRMSYWISAGWRWNVGLTAPNRSASYNCRS